jgi:hypothetical protein
MTAPNQKQGFAPVALCGKRMPDPFLFAAMLTGEFAADRD